MAEEESTQGRSRKRGRAPRSAVWEHFTRFTAADGKDKARCKLCHLVLGAATKSGTSSLWGHVKICSERNGVRRELHRTQAPPPPCAPSRSAESLKGATGFEEEVAAAATATAGGDLARMITLNGYDPSVVEDNHFRSFVQRLNPAFKLPTRQAIEEMCDDIFDRTRTDLFSRLRHTSGRISLAVGKAEAIEGDVFYTSCHFIDNDWNLHRVVMDAYDYLPVPVFHGPLYGVPEVAPGSRDKSLLAIDRPRDICLLAIDRVMYGGENDIPGLNALDRVFMVALTKPNDYIKEKYPSPHPGRRREVVCDTYMDIVLHTIGRKLVLNRDLVIDMVYVHAVESEVQNLRLTRQRCQHLLSYLGLDNLRAYNERWYSSYCSLEVLRSEGSCIIPGIDMELIQVLCNVWRTIYCAIKRISVSSTPTSNLCLAELFSVREVLQTEIARAGGDIADALRKTRDILDKSLEDSYLVWSIPLVLDPRYKLKYIEFSFRRAFSPERAAYYISEVTRNIRNLYSDYVQYDGGTSGTSSDVSKVMTDGRVGTLEQAWDEHCRTQAGMTPEVAISYPEARTELDRYLQDCLAPRTESFDILNWWKVHSLEYPRMARMARDALAMPTCSQLSAEQIAHVRSIIRGYSKEYYKHQAGLV